MSYDDEEIMSNHPLLEICYNDFKKIYDYVNDVEIPIDEVLDNIRTICKDYIEDDN